MVPGSGHAAQLALVSRQTVMAILPMGVRQICLLVFKIAGHVDMPAQRIPPVLAASARRSVWRHSQHAAGTLHHTVLISRAIQPTADPVPTFVLQGSCALPAYVLQEPAVVPTLPFAIVLVSIRRQMPATAEAVDVPAEMVRIVWQASVQRRHAMEHLDYPVSLHPLI